MCAEIKSKSKERMRVSRKKKYDHQMTDRDATKDVMWLHHEELNLDETVPCDNEDTDDEGSLSDVKVQVADNADLYCNY